MNGPGPVPAKSVTASTVDGVTLRGVLLRPALDAGELAIVVGHGFTNHVRKPWVRRVLDRLAARLPVVALDFRGHGRSDGRSTVGADEVLDLDAGIAIAREHGYSQVATLGFSMGASIVIRQAGLGEAAGHQRVDAVVAVSGPARWWSRDTTAMRRVHWLLEQPHGRLATAAIGVRLGRPWLRPPASPLELVHRIPPTPLLIVHGEQDHYFAPEHAVTLHRAARGGAELWLEPEMRHAESAMTPQLVDRIVGWLVDRATAHTPAPLWAGQDGTST